MERDLNETKLHAFFTDKRKLKKDLIFIYFDDEPEEKFVISA